MKSKNKMADIWIILIFVFTLTLPQIFNWVLDNKEQEISTTENRKLNSKPIFKLSNIMQYPTNYENYYNDHLPFRTALRNIWTNINYDIFNTTIDSRVIIGKDNWLFYRGDKSIEQVQGIAKYTDKEKESILTNLQNNANKFKEKNIEMYVLILPNKENLYKEKLPNSIRIKDNTSRTEELIDYIRENSNIDVVYPKDELLLAKEKYQVYRKYDTHWNGIGSFIGTIELQKAIDANFNYNYDNMNIEEVNAKDGNDLANFANLNERLYENVLKVNNFYSDIEYTKKDNGIYEEYISNSDNDKTILFIGDSFRGNVKEYLSKIYKKSIYIHRDNYNKNIIEEFKPDIVIIETVERFSKEIGRTYI